MAIGHQTDTVGSKIRLRSYIVRWMCVAVLSLAITIICPCHGHAATKSPEKKGTSLAKVKHVATAGKSKSNLKRAARKTSHAKAKQKQGKKHATMNDRIRAKKVKQARLISRQRPQSRMAQVSGAADRARDMGIPPMDLWVIRAYEQELAAKSDDRPVDASTLKIIKSAYSYIGTPYRYGGTTPEGFDCSGFVRHVFGENGISLNRTSREQFRQGKAVPLSAVRPGDLIFFGKVKREHCRIEHVGLYIGEGRFIHAASSRTGQVKISTLKPPDQRTRNVMARRVLDDTAEEP